MGCTRKILHFINLGIYTKPPNLESWAAMNYLDRELGVLRRARSELLKIAVYNLSSPKPAYVRNMKGSKFVAEPKTRQHLKDDYRDPELPDLPPVEPFEYQREECSSIGSLSMQNVLSDPWLVDHLRKVGFEDGSKRLIHDVEYIKSKRVAILRKAQEAKEKKSKRLKTRDIAEGMTRLLLQGYHLTHAVMVELLKRDDKMLQALKTVHSESITSRAPLKSNTDGRFIMNVLKEWENHIFEKDKAKAGSTLLYLTLYFQTRNDPSYYWLVYELYHLALHSCKGCKGNLTEAVIRYLLGKFLIQKASHFKEAELHLERACHLSYGYNWTTTFVTREPNDHIHDNSNYLLHVILIKRAVESSYKHPLKAVNLVKQALRVIKRSKNDAAIADAYFDLAVMKNRAHMPERAMNIIGKAMEIYLARNDGKNICLSLLLAAHCLRRNNDPNESVKILKMLIIRAKQFNLPSMAAKGYKHLAEYYLGRGKYHSASVYYKKSCDLLEKCDLRDELDEVTVAHSYTVSWLRIHDTHYMLLKATCKEPEELFDFSDFVELGVPFFNRFFKLRFVYKMIGSDAKEVADEQPTEPIRTTTEQLQNGTFFIINEDQGRALTAAPSNRKYDVPEFHAFGDFIGMIHDEELDQAMELFEKIGIDAESDLVVKTLKSIQFKHREGKRSVAYLAAMEIFGAQKLSCLQNGFYTLPITIDLHLLRRKLLLVDHQIQEDFKRDYEKQNEHKLWNFTVEIHLKQPLGIYEEWKYQVQKGINQLQLDKDSPPELYKALLEAIVPLADIYRLYDSLLRARELLLEKKREDADDEQLPETGSTKADGNASKEASFSSRVFTVDSLREDATKPIKICRCKEIF